MTTALVVGAQVQVRIWCADVEQASVNTLEYIVAAVSSPAATDQDVADNLSVAFNGLYKAVLSDTAFYRGVQVRIGASPGLLFTAPVFNNSSAGPGTAGAVGLPRQTCGLVSYQTLFSGQANRGRSYIPFPAQADDATFGVPGATYLTNLGLLAGDMGVGLSISVGARTATLVRVLIHRKNKAGATPPPSPITSFSISLRWATQRRRGSFGRANASPI
jgi:hypothetical protein